MSLSSTGFGLSLVNVAKLKSCKVDHDFMRVRAIERSLMLANSCIIIPGLVSAEVSNREGGCDPSSCYDLGLSKLPSLFIRGI